MEAQKILVALLASAAQSGARQLSLVPTTEALRVFLSVGGQRIWILEARPELGEELMDLARQMTVDGEGEFALELEGREVRISVVLSQQQCHLHLAGEPPELSYSAVLRLSREEKVQRVAESLLAAAAASDHREVRLEPGEVSIEALGKQGDDWLPLLEDVVPMTLYGPILCHLKRISGLPPGDASSQQFGRFQLEMGGKDYQILLSANPTSAGHQCLQLRLTPL